MQQHAFLTGLLKNRLLIEDLLRRHPEILEERIVAPIIICGLPRTGTTHLHNLMSADPALRSLPYWESLEPVLAERERPAPGAPDPRKERTEMALSFLDAAMPYFKRMHEMTVEHTHEEIQLLAIDFSTMLFETTAPDADVARRTTWRVTSGRATPTCSRVLKVLQWLRGGTRWVLKSPQHLEQFPALVDTFPDATFVVTHRDPVSVTASMVTMIAYTRTAHPRPGRRRGDRPLLGGPARAHAGPLRRRARRPAGGPDDRRALRRVHGRRPGHGGTGLRPGRPAPRRARPEPPWRPSWPSTPGAATAPCIYDLGEFGLDAAERRRALAFYTERFGVTLES